MYYELKFMEIHSKSLYAIFGPDFHPTVEQNVGKLEPKIRSLHLFQPQCSENKFPHERRSREWGNLFLLRLLSHEWGKYNVP